MKRTLAFCAPFFVLLLSVTWSLSSAQSRYKEAEVKNGGTISGTVRLRDRFHADSFVITKDEAVCGRMRPSPRLVVGEKMGVANAIVFLDGVKEGKRWERDDVAVLDQKKCAYNPHILMVPLGSELDIVNSDGILHNVHTYDMNADLHTLFNIAQPIKGQRTPVKGTLFKHPGLVLATCDAGHPWMSAYIMVTEHPYYAVTDETGRFVLTDIPPGAYRLKMWHEGVSVTRTEEEGGVVKKYHFEDAYEETREITVPAGGKVESEFELVLRKTGK